MVVKSQLANGNCEIFETPNYLLSKKTELHPMILKCTVYTNSGKKIYSVSRRLKWFYKKFIFPSAKVQDELKKIQEERMKNMNPENVPVQN